MDVTGRLNVLQTVAQGSVFFLLNVSADPGPPQGPLLGHRCSGNQRERRKSEWRIVQDISGARPESGIPHFGPHSTG